MNLLLRYPWILFLSVATLLFLAGLLGHKLASRTSVNDDPHDHEHITGLRDGLFVLLSLLLGYTVAIVLPRFDERTNLVVEEAQAIHTTMLRAELLPEPERSRSLDILRQYVMTRQGFGELKLSEGPQLADLIQQTTALQEQLWQQTVLTAQQTQTGVIASYIQALNEAIAVSEKRLANFENRVPESVWIIILLVAAFQSFVAGYSLKRRFWLRLVVTPIVVAVVIALIADLDSPHTGLVRIKQNSMQRLVSDVTSSH